MDLRSASRFGRLIVLSAPKLSPGVLYSLFVWENVPPRLVDLLGAVLNIDPLGDANSFPCAKPSFAPLAKSLKLVSSAIDPSRIL